MIRIPIDSSKGDVVLELDEESRYLVRLTFELEPQELTGRRRANEAVDAILADPTVAGPEARTLELDEGFALFSEVLELRARLERLENEHDVYRELLPTEAREVAAVLWHYSTEAEAR